MDEPLLAREPDDGIHRMQRAALIHVDSPVSDAPSWVMTYSDIIAQLVCLLILLLSFAHFVPTRFQQLQGAVEQTFGRRVDNIGPTDRPPAEPSSADGSATSARGRLDGLRLLVSRHSGRLTGGQVDVEVFEDYRGVVLRLGNTALFDPREVFVRPSAWPFLEAVGAHATSEGARLDIEVRVAPMADVSPDTEIQRAGARGLALARYLLGQDGGLSPDRLSVRAIGANERTAVMPVTPIRAQADAVDFVFSRAPAQTDLPL